MQTPFFHFSDQIRAILGPSLSVIAHISPSVDLIGSSFTMHPASKFFSTLLCSHLGPSNRHLSPGWERQPPRSPISCPPPHYISLPRPLASWLFLPIMAPLRSLFSQPKCFPSGYPCGSFLAPFRPLLKYHLHSKIRPWKCKLCNCYPTPRLAHSFHLLYFLPNINHHITFNIFYFSCFSTLAFFSLALREQRDLWLFFLSSLPRT